jgi:D-serine deaminase-like pyridoxal phosphate-dependent protein
MSSDRSTASEVTTPPDLVAVPDRDRAAVFAPAEQVGKTVLDTPCLLLDLERVERNIERMAKIASAAGVSLRPHAKSHKLAPVARLQVAAGATGLTVAKISEAEVFVDAGIDDVFIAFPIWGKPKWERVCALARRARLTFSVDSAAVLEGLSSAAATSDVELGVRLEIDTGFERCGLQSPAESLALAKRTIELPGVTLNGLMSFAGQSYEERDDDGRSRVAQADATILLRHAAELREHGISVPSISVGGTPTARHAAGIDGVTEIRPGTYVLSDRDQVALGWGDVDDCALTVMTTVVSRPTTSRAVIDAGTKAFSSDLAGEDGLWGLVVGHPELRMTRLTEEHGIVEVPAGVELPIGSRLEVVPNHACGTLNMHDATVVTRGDHVIDIWPITARGKLT